jgi:hypothetical protein
MLARLAPVLLLAACASQPAPETPAGYRGNTLRQPEAEPGPAPQRGAVADLPLVTVFWPATAGGEVTAADRAFADLGRVLAQCYGEELREEPGSVGNVRFTIRLGSDGQAKEVAKAVGEGSFLPEQRCEDATVDRDPAAAGFQMKCEPDPNSMLRCADEAIRWRVFPVEPGTTPTIVFAASFKQPEWARQEAAKRARKAPKAGEVRGL